MNFHLRAAGQEEITNLGKNLADSRKLLYVLNQLDGEKCTLEALEEADDVARASKMLENTTKIGVEDVLGPNDLVKGNARINAVLVAAIFNAKHGLQELTQEEYAAAGLIDDDIEASMEERTFRMWINSMQIEGCFVENLFEELGDGLIILKVCHRIDPTSVDLSKVNMNPKNVFQADGNCAMAEEAMRKCGVKLIGMGAADLRDKNRKNILGMVWQLMRAHYLKLIGGKTDAALCAWVNETVQPEVPITGFGD